MLLLFEIYIRKFIKLKKKINIVEYDLIVWNVVNL